MSFINTLKTAFIALLSNKVRSLLTMLGVIIGVFAVVSLIALGQGLQNYISNQFDELGSNLIFIATGRANFTNDPGLSLADNDLKEKHVNLIKDFAGEYISYISPSIRVGKTVEYKNNTYYADVNGANENAYFIYNYELERGRWYSHYDVVSKNKVAVLGPEATRELFGNSDPIGRKIKVEGENFEIIGLTKTKGPDFDNNVNIPYTVSMEIFDLESISHIIIKVKKSESVTATMSYVRSALSRDLEDDEFSVLSQQDLLSSIQNILNALTFGIGAIAAISLLVGGIGIMNIMLVSVTERIREIGLRKALGATPNNIATQFLLEAILLSVTGGIVGIALGYVGMLIMRNFLNATVPLWAVSMAFGFSALVGIVFGTYPAYKASKKDPIEALRYE